MKILNQCLGFGINWRENFGIARVQKSETDNSGWERNKKIDIVTRNSSEKIVENI